MTLPLTSFDLTEAHFNKVKDLLYRICGISLKAGKEGLVKARLSKRLRALGMDSFDSYLEYVEKDRTQEELPILVDAMTTNKTSFFRESQHFDFLSQKLLPQWQHKRKMRFWSAACSSGEEPFTLAMVLREKLADIDARDVRILATDISPTVLNAARQGSYTKERVDEVPAPLRHKYFTGVGPRPQQLYEVDAAVQKLVHFAQLNLMDPWPMQGPFDAIFCRNVMIYFDKETQGALIRRFHDLLIPGGHLFIGHSESLTGIEHPFRYVQPALYVRQTGATA